MLKHDLGFVEHQEKGTYGLGSKLTITKNKNGAVLDKTGLIADGGIKIDHIHSHLPHYTPSISQQRILADKIVCKTLTQLQ